MKKQSIVRKILSGSPIKKYTQPGLVIDTTGGGAVASASKGVANAISDKITPKEDDKDDDTDTEHTQKVVNVNQFIEGAKKKGVDVSSEQAKTIGEAAKIMGDIRYK